MSDQVTSPGNRRQVIYRTDADRRRCVGLLAELPERCCPPHGRTASGTPRRVGASATAVRLRSCLPDRSAGSARRGPWREMVEDWGDWGRDGTIYVAVRHGRQRLVDVVRAVGGITYGAAAQAVRRLATGLPQGLAKGRFVEAMRRRIG